MTESQPESNDIELVTIPATQVTPEDVGALSVRYTDGVPELVLTGGRVVPKNLAVTDGAGNVLASYTTVSIARSASVSMPPDTQNGLYTADMTVIFDAVPRP
ncbi:hypothetical protein OG874_44010 [Nocardia sp. NBC_00565]|uniref:hypothetical protein n=1 Tax=Nocardia sp. NBC_00565 TaxID=2975993 RepID=UPI002E7FC1BA|nr:hypothetical protein [Nocardia sp. NBC_00565]WUC03533.1 hypothetical protein OG874_44010 [Nocardia sp. NBC_00565]